MSRIKVTCKEVQLHLMSQSTLTLFYFLFSLKYLRQKLLHSQTRVQLFYCFLEGKTKTKKTPELSETKMSRKYKLFLNSTPSRGSARYLASHITVFPQSSCQTTANQIERDHYISDWSANNYTTRV